MRPAGLDDVPDFALFRAQHIAQMFERRREIALHTQGGTDMNRRRDRVIAALSHVDMIVRVHRLAQPPCRQRCNHFVGVHVRAGARARLEYVDGKVLIVPARSDICSGGVDGLGDLRIEQLEDECWHVPPACLTRRALR